MAESDDTKKQEQRERAAKWIAERWTNRQCPMCGTSQWSVGDISELREFAQGAIIIGGGALYPVFPITCANCGNTVAPLLPPAA
jgi:hypothetical protein